MKINIRDSLLYHTGQAWKYWMHIWSTLVGVFLAFLAIWFGGVSPTGYYMLLLLAGLTITVIGIVFAVFSIKCPNCGARWYWSAVTKKHEIGGINWFLTLKACPVCGATGKDADDKRAEEVRAHSP
jgi:hypothetical protein